MSNTPTLRFYRDESLSSNHLDKLNEIYQLFKDDHPKWISRNECLNLKSAENNIFVFSLFEGQAFEHLRTFKARIISAHCMAMSLNNNCKLPRSIIPIYSLAMKDLVICCTNIKKEIRQDIYDKVELMQGKHSGIFTETITHLVTTEVGSAKYHAAAGTGINVMLPEWILEVWKRSESGENIRGTDEEFNKYKCPIFNKYVICASGFNEELKNELKNLIKSNGGTYSGDLVMGTVTHLVTKEAKGNKYEYAKEWKIAVVKEDWIHESIKTGYCQQEKNFQFESTNQTSTPTENRQMKKRAAPDIDISVINNNNNNNNNKISLPNEAKCVNETDANFRNMSSTMLNSTAINSSMSASVFNKPNNNANNSKNDVNKPLSNFSDAIKELNSIGKINLALFDGIGIYFENFDATVMEKLKKICNSGGATRFDEYNSDVTHVIVNQVNEAKCKLYNEMNPEVNIVTIDWLIKSCKQNEIEDCKEYVVFKNSLNSVKTPKKRARPEQKPNTNTSKTLGDSDLDCLQQYLNVEAALTKPKTSMMPPPTNLFGGFQVKDATNSNNSTNTSSRTSKTNYSPIEITTENKTINETKQKSTENKLFSNFKFQIFGFNEAETEEQEKFLIEKGAQIVKFDANVSFSSYKNKDIDYTLLPMTIPAATSNNNPATIYWVKKCIEKNKILQLNEDVFYQPIPKYNEEKPLSNCVITISGLSIFEKDNITNLCKLLGACVQAQLCFKDTPEKDLLGNTHLICNKAIGPKYVAAKSWNLPSVGSEWVIDSCVTGIKADENKYSIENKINKEELIEALAKIRRNDETLNSNNDYTSYANNNDEISKSNSSNLNRKSDIFSGAKESNQVNDAVEEQNFNDSSISYQNETKKPRLDQEEEEVIEIDADEEHVLAAIENNVISNKKQAESKDFKTPDPINIAAAGGVCNPRLKELKQSAASNSTPLQKTPNENSNTSYLTKTPIWLKPGDQSMDGSFKCGFDFETNFVTPKFNTNKTRAKNVETPLEKIYADGVRGMMETSREGTGIDEKFQSPAFDYSFQKGTPEHRYRLDFKPNENQKLSAKPSADLVSNSQQYNIENESAKKTKQILKNARIYVSKKLVKKQTEIYQTAEELGAEFLWAYDNTCTHFVYTGKLTDPNKELKLAKEENKIIITPNWISACKELNYRVDENQYVITLQNSLKSPFVRRNQSSQINALDYIEAKQETTEAIKDFKSDLNESEEKNQELEQEDEEQEEAAAVDKVEVIEEEENLAKEEEMKIDDATDVQTIPDSMDIKVMLLGQLQERLAIMKDKPEVSSHKKWIKNNSSGFSVNTNISTDNSDVQLISNDHTRRSDFAGNNQDETVLSEKQALNELNDSRSKWGINSGVSETRKRTKSFSESYDKKNNNNNENDDSDMMLLNSFICKQVDDPKKIGNNLKRIDNNLADSKMFKQPNNGCLDEPNSPSLVKKYAYSNDNGPPMSSQIQVTMWKDDQNYPTSTNTSNSSGSRKKNASNSKSNDREAIAERFINASRASSKK